MLRPRKTRSVRKHSQRRTRKQRGGANWYRIPEERATIWRTYMTENAPTLKERLPLLFDISGDNRLTSDNLSAVMEEYMRIIEYQDELFAAAIEIIKRQLDKSNAAPADLIEASPTIDGRKTDLMAYMDDVEALINFNVDTKVNDELGKTKLQSIRSTDAETLTTLLLYPKRVENVFIQALAEIFVFLKQTPSILDQSATSESIMKIAIAQNQSDIYANAYVLTARPLRDGFFLNQGEIEFTTETSTEKFWIPLFQALVDGRNKTEEELRIFKKGGDPCPSNLKGEGVTWASIAADVFFAYKFDKIDNILEYFKVKCGDEQLPPDVQRRENQFIADQPYYPIPESSYDNVDVRGSTLDILLSNMDDSTLQFLLHLTYTIKHSSSTG
jgi:hypothetical protein